MKKRAMKIFLLILTLFSIIKISDNSAEAASAKKPVMNQVVVKGYDSLGLSWKKVSGVSGYVVYRKSGKSSFKTISTISGANKCSFVDKKLNTGTKYIYAVKTFIKSGKKKIYSGYSKNVSGTPKLTKPVIKKAVLSGKKLSLSWDKISGASGYDVYKSQKKTGSYALAKTLSGNGTTTL